MQSWAHSPQAKEAPELLDDFDIIERIVPQTKPRGILGISFGSIKIEEGDATVLPVPEARQSEEEPLAAPKKSLFSFFRKSPAAEEEGDEESGNTEAEEEAPLDRTARKRARKEDKEAERARKKAEKQARKDAKRAAAGTAMEAAESYTDDLPGPPPESLRRPYPELRKPISAKPKRSRPEPFPELRKPPGERRPPPEPFPELRKPALERARQETEDNRQAEEPADTASAPDTVSSQEGRSEPEPKRSGGWLSDVLKSAERFEAQTQAAPFDLEDEEEDETAPAENEAPPPLHPDEPLSQDTLPAEEEEAPVPMDEPESAAQEGDVEDRSYIDDDDRRRADEALAEAALPDEYAQTAAEAPLFETNSPEEDEAAAFAGDPELGDYGTPDDAVHEAAELREDTNAALEEDTDWLADEAHERSVQAARRERRRTARRRTPPGQLELGLPADPPEEPEAWEQPETPPSEPNASAAAGDMPDAPEWTAGDDLTAQETDEYVSPSLTEQDREQYAEDDGELERAEELDAYGGQWDDEEETGAVPSSWQDEPYPDVPEAIGGAMAEPVEHYAHGQAEQGTPELAEPAELTDPPQDDAEEPDAAEPSVLSRYADLLDPTYRPKHGFMDLGRPSILFPDEETDADADPDAVWDDGMAEPPDHGAHPDDSGATDQWPAYTEYSDALDGNGDPGIVDVRNNGHGMGGDSTALPGEPAMHRVYTEGAETEEPPAWPDLHGDDGEDEGAEGAEDEEPVFVPPEPSGRPEEAAALMRTIAHTDTEYYLPPSKTPGMILLGLAGAALGAFLANTLYGMLDDVVVPHFMVILIGVQIFGGAGVMLGATFTVPIGQRKRRSRAIRLDSNEWADHERGEAYAVRDPLPPEPHFSIPAASTERQNARAAMRSSANGS